MFVRRGDLLPCSLHRLRIAPPKNSSQYAGCSSLPGHRCDVPGTSYDPRRAFLRELGPERRFSTGHGFRGRFPTKSSVLLHRGHEHSARWRRDGAVSLVSIPGEPRSLRGTSAAMANPRANADGRQISRCRRPRSRLLGELPFAEDARHSGGSTFAVIAHSVAAVIASAWVHDYAPRIRALVLGTPAFRVKLYLPLAIPSLRLLQKIRGKAFIKSYVGGKLLTHDPPLASRKPTTTISGHLAQHIAVNILLDLYDTATRLLADAVAGHPNSRRFCSSPARTWWWSRRHQRQFFERLSSRVKELEVLPGLLPRHLSRGKPNARCLRAAISGFRAAPIRRLKPDPMPSLLDADQAGYFLSHEPSTTSFVKSPLPPVSLARVLFGDPQSLSR